MSLKSRRRYLLHKLQFAAEQENDMDCVWRAKHNAATPATPLPANFPSRSKLVAAEYTCIEDVDGADIDELVDKVDLTREEAAAALAAIEAL